MLCGVGVRAWCWSALSALGLGVLAGCGGGGGSADGLGSNEGAGASSLRVQPSSYLNFKNNGLQPQTLPVFGDARAYGHFSSAERLGLVMAQLTYSPTQALAQATPATLSMWEQGSDGVWRDVSSKLSQTAACIHPRKALTADFNGDGVADVFIACHGYDAGDFPGERSVLLLSDRNRNYEVSSVLDIGYWHGATAFDVDRDGDVDSVLLDARDERRVVTYLNDGAGGFERDVAMRFPDVFGGKGYYSIEAIDVNGDGHEDMLVGGHEVDPAPTVLMMNPGDGDFSQAEVITLPAAEGYGVVLDFTFTSSPERSLWVLRTGDDPFYQGRALQRIRLDDLSAEMAQASPSGDWVRWVLPVTASSGAQIASDRQQDDYVVPYD
jgi:hypothetical protein